MASRRRTTKSPEFDGEFDITPMIDVVFLLLIFFIVTARMAPKNVGSLPEAKFGETHAASEAAVINVKAAAPDSPIVSRKDGSVFSADKDVQAQEISDYLIYQMESKGMRFVMICAEPEVKSREIARIRDIVSRELAPEQEIMIAVQQ